MDKHWPRPRLKNDRLWLKISRFSACSRVYHRVIHITTQNRYSQEFFVKNKNKNTGETGGLGPPERDRVMDDVDEDVEEGK